MDDDMNTADALSAIFELTREINAYNGAHQTRPAPSSPQRMICSWS